MKNNLFCVIALLFLLSGCVPKILYRPDVTQDERKKDGSTCKKEAGQAGFGSRNIFNLCMISIGYTFREK
jgi:hypothetical protein